MANGSKGEDADKERTRARGAAKLYEDKIRGLEKELKEAQDSAEVFKTSAKGLRDELVKVREATRDAEKVYRNRINYLEGCLAQRDGRISNLISIVDKLKAELEHKKAWWADQPLSEDIKRKTDAAYNKGVLDTLKGEKGSVPDKPTPAHWKRLRYDPIFDVDRRKAKGCKCQEMLDAGYVIGVCPVHGFIRFSKWGGALCELYL